MVTWWRVAAARFGGDCGGSDGGGEDGGGEGGGEGGGGEGGGGEGGSDGGGGDGGGEGGGGEGGGKEAEERVVVAMVEVKEAEERVVVVMVEARGVEERVVDKVAVATAAATLLLYTCRHGCTPFLAQGFKQFRLASRCARRSRRCCSTSPCRTQLTWTAGRSS